MPYIKKDRMEDLVEVEKKYYAICDMLHTVIRHYHIKYNVSFQQGTIIKTNKWITFINDVIKQFLDDAKISIK
jgi:hypothetical protein